MERHIGMEDYVPGAYRKPRPSTQNLVDAAFARWESTRGRKIVDDKTLPPCLCFSRKIGVGALEIADMVGEHLDLPVVDRQIMEYIAENAGISARTAALFDERYPGTAEELTAMLVGEKSFILSDYTRQFFRAVVAMAGMDSIVFVGRGVHLLLPRDRVMAVRVIASFSYRARRLAEITGVTTDQAEKMVRKMDAEQRDFFRKVFRKDDASPYEFDLTLNMDRLEDPALAARVVETAFTGKYGTRILRTEKAA